MAVKEMALSVIAKKVAPALVKKMLPNLKEVSALAAILSSNILEYGYQSKKIIADSRLEAFKEFLPVADKFFDNLNDTVQISIELKDKHYTRIIDFVLDNETVSFNQKIDAYIRIEKLRKKKQMETIKIVLSATVLTLLGEAAIRESGKVNTDKSYNKRKAKEAKYKYRKK